LNISSPGPWETSEGINLNKNTPPPQIEFSWEKKEKEDSQ